jgi:integrase/recombinase XerD
LTDRGVGLSPVFMEKFQIALAREYRAAAATLLGRSAGDKRPKQRKTQYYPIVESVGTAILNYLQWARPRRCASRDLFVTLKAPFRRLSPGGLYHVVSRRLHALGIETTPWGPHGLRHACAAHLLAEGLSLKEIGDHLGHRSTYATRTYARVDLAGLREVADFDLGGLS